VSEGLVDAQRFSAAYRQFGGRKRSLVEIALGTSPVSVPSRRDSRKDIVGLRRRRLHPKPILTARATASKFALLVSYSPTIQTPVRIVAGADDQVGARHSNAPEFLTPSSPPASARVD